jgi:hypothetical protein
MAHTLTKHVARRQEQTFADWFAELREVARYGAAARHRSKPFTWSGSFSRPR